MSGLMLTIHMAALVVFLFFLLVFFFSLVLSDP